MKTLWLLVLAVATGLATTQAKASEATAPAAVQEILVLLKQIPIHARGGSGYAGTYGDAFSKAARERRGRQIAREAALGFAGNWPMPLLGLDCFILAVPTGTSIAQAVTLVSRHKDVEWVQPVNQFTTLQSAITYNDPLFAVAPVARQWHLAQLHKLATGRGVTIAIVDSQIDAEHPDLKGQVAVMRDFVTGHTPRAEEHGTGVAGIVAAKANNGVGMAGVAPQARLYGLRACWQGPVGDGSICNSLSLAKALHYAVDRGVDIVNLSLTGPYDPLLARLIDIAVARGTAIVASADANSAEGGFPASLRGVIAVSDAVRASAPNGVVSAPGRGIPTTQTGARWYIVNGSSFATAHVSGLVALMRERSSNDAGRRRDAFILNADGGGTIDARATLRAVASGRDRQRRR